MSLVQPYYIDKRQGESHISLDGQWDFCWTDEVVESLESLQFSYETAIPSSVYHSLHKAGILPDPYIGTNSMLYHWVDEKVWYYRKTFRVDASASYEHAYLCFDGIAYYAKVWINGHLLGEHEGMFGGPVVDVRQYLQAENEIVLEVQACNFGKKDSFDPWNPKGENREIVPWNIARDKQTSNGGFIVLGLWNHVRLELLQKIHFSRPYLYTERLEENRAVLQLQLQIADGSLPELFRLREIYEECYSYTRAYDSGLTGKTQEKSVEIEITIADGETPVYQSREQVPLTDFVGLGMDERFWELQYYQKEILLDNPKLWYPNGLGEAFLYDVTVSVSFAGAVCDTQHFKFGVRTFTAEYTKGNKYRMRWNKFLFSINGEPFFLKGMNWIPIDFLYDISPERYAWCLRLAKNVGIQMIRVWNGGGMPETDVFYDLCDELGLLVWQDGLIANTISTENYPQEILECQLTYNLYRIRNHASFVLFCGGNEFNPYTEGNAASMYVTQRAAQALIPDRIFHDTTADKGSAHIYIDMEPVWYRHRYKELPFLAESGIHSFPNFKTLQKFVCEKETSSRLPDLSAPEFLEQYPELLNHFAEYIPERVPRMTARISQIVDMSHVTLADLCEASQVQVYEFYQLMIEAMWENYPVCGGVMPWVFKRPWPTAGVQTVDGDDRPGYGYYAVQNAYRSVHIAWCQQWSVLAPDETVPLNVKVFNQNNVDLSETEVCLTVYNPDLSVCAEYKSAYQPVCDFGTFKLPDTFTNTCFLVCAELTQAGQVLARSVYFNKCTDMLQDASLYETYRTMPTENLRLDKGPWLKPCICAAKQAEIAGEITQRGFDGTYHFADITVKNISDVPAYPVTLDLENANQRHFLNDNFFLLKPGEKKTVRLTCDSGKVETVKIDFWNGETISIK